MKKLLEIKKSAYKGKGSIWMPLVLLFFVCVMPAYSLFVNNVGEIRFIEIFLIMLAAYAIGLAVFGFLWLFLRNRMVAGLIACVSLFLFMNFSFIYDAVYKNMVQVKTGYISYAISLVIVVFLSGLLIYFTIKSPLIPKSITLFFLIVLTSNIVLTTAFATPGIIKTVQQSSGADAVYDDAADYNMTASPDRIKPNIYFIITDEYGSFPFMNKYYHYDNAEFRTFLSANKFNVSQTSFSYYDDTYKCLGAVTSLRPLDSIKTTKASKEQLLKKDNLQYQLLEKLGYDILEVSTHKMYHYERINKQDIISSVFKSRAANGDSSLKIILDRTMINWFLDFAGLGTYISSENVIDYFTEGEYLGNSSPTAYFCYILSPHAPFTHDEQGNKISSDDDDAWGIPEIYVGQHKYTTKLLMGAIDNILKNDPGSVIILQSDHGVRNHPEGTPPHSFVIEEADTRSIFNVVYFSGEPLDIQGLSAVNTWRLVLNRLGVDMDLIDDSSYKVVVDESAQVMSVPSLP